MIHVICHIIGFWGINEISKVESTSKRIPELINKIRKIIGESKQEPCEPLHKPSNKPTNKPTDKPTDKPTQEPTTPVLKITEFKYKKNKIK